MTQPRRIDGQLDVVEFRADGIVVRAAPGSVVHTTNGWAVTVGDDGLAFLPYERPDQDEEPSA